MALKQGKIQAKYMVMNTQWPATFFQAANQNNLALVWCRSVGFGSTGAVGRRAQSRVLFLHLSKTCSTCGTAASQPPAPQLWGELSPTEELIWAMELKVASTLLCPSPHSCPSIIQPSLSAALLWLKAVLAPQPGSGGRRGSEEAGSEEKRQGHQYREQFPASCCDAASSCPAAT